MQEEVKEDAQERMAKSLVALEQVSRGSEQVEHTPVF